MVEEPTLHTLGMDDVPEAGALLARAFRDNPGMIAMLDSDDADRRLRLLQGVLPGFVASYVRHGVARGVRLGAHASDPLAAVALTLNPGSYPPSLGLQWGLTRAVAFNTPVRIALRFSVADTWMKRHHMHEPHHYLFMLGVEPEQQGHGHGSTLLRDLGARADAQSAVCYLETDKASSVRLYQRNGYVVTHEATLPKVRDMKLWFMRRTIV